MTITTSSSLCQGGHLSGLQLSGVGVGEDDPLSVLLPDLAAEMLQQTGATPGRSSNEVYTVCS